jgi:GDP-4-dehydro-6-deoxy-D-mannose reductase
VPADLLLTGGNGFVGRHLLRCASARNLDSAVARVDLRDAQAVDALIRDTRPRAIVHLADRRPGDDPWFALRDGVAMIANLVRAVTAWSPDAVLLATGSAAQYGHGGPEPLPESTPLAPVTAYAAVKCTLEAALISPLTEVRAIFTRSFNHVGPGQPVSAPAAAWVRQIADAEVAGGGAIRTGRLDVVRDFLDVRDVADAYLDLVASGAQGIFNVCSGKGHRLDELAEILAGLAAVPIEFELDPTLVRSTDPPAVVGDPTRLRTETRWEPTRTIDRSLADALDEARAIAPVGRAR